LLKNKVFTQIEENEMKRLQVFFYYLQRSLPFIAFFSFFLGCRSENENEAEIEVLPISVTLDRFDLKFYTQTADVIPELKKNYPYLFPRQYSDSVWVARQKDSLQLLLQEAVQEVFKDVSPLEKKLTHLFKHVQYHFPNLKIPHLVTLTNNVDYQIKTVYSDSLVLISLDTFLGASHPLYEGIPSYIKKELDQKFIPSQIVEKLGNYVIPPVEDRTFLAQMLFEGKKMYLQDLLLPHDTDSIKMAYTSEELAWANENELYIWQYFIERQVLYSTDPEWIQRFLEPAPFSKFYLQLDNESPGRVGKWMGWQIVRSFMAQNPEITVEQLLKMPAQKLFNLSKYKPRR
jgi:gliding motility-associated lipoprotein GldB